MSGGLARLHALPRDRAIADLLRCCASRRWAEQLEARRPFASEADLHRTAESVWSALPEQDHLEAFAHHPRIGGTTAQQPMIARTHEWSRTEQSRMAAASPDQRAEFLRLNGEYEQRFGFVFLICATGKEPAEMLGALRSRLENDRSSELSNAAHQQMLITRLRIEKMLSE